MISFFRGNSMKKYMKEKEGISLIVLIVTIIVMIILASTVILTLNQNNPIESAKEAAFKSDISNIQDELSVYISNNYVTGQQDNDIESLELSGDEMVNKLSSSKNYKKEKEYFYKIVKK